MKEWALTTAVFSPLYGMTKRVLSGGIHLEGLSKAVIDCEGRFWTISLTAYRDSEI